MFLTYIFLQIDNRYGKIENPSLTKVFEEIEPGIGENSKPKSCSEAKVVNTHKHNHTGKVALSTVKNMEKIIYYFLKNVINFHPLK